MTQRTIEEMIGWMGLKDGEIWASDDDEKMFQHVCAALTAQPTIELKPCPFCGGAGAIHPNGIGDYYVRCNLCESRTDQARCEEPEHAAKRWNTRSALTAQALPEAQTADAKRLDYLDARNAAKNLRHGTKYGWKLSENCNRIALDDSNWPPLKLATTLLPPIGSTEL